MTPVAPSAGVESNSSRSVVSVQNEKTWAAARALPATSVRPVPTVTVISAPAAQSLWPMARIRSVYQTEPVTVPDDRVTLPAAVAGSMASLNMTNTLSSSETAISPASGPVATISGAVVSVVGGGVVGSSSPQAAEQDGGRDQAEDDWQEFGSWTWMFPP